VPAILAGLRRGRTVVRVTGPDAPMIVFTTSVPLDGDTVRVQKTRLVVDVTGGAGQVFRFVRNGQLFGEEIVIDADPFHYEARISAPATGEDRYRAEVIDDVGASAITSHVWITRPASGGGGGCAASTARPSSRVGLVCLSAFAVLVVARRRRSTVCRTIR
jgi:hypothetical protein